MSTGSRKISRPSKKCKPPSVVANRDIRNAAVVPVTHGLAAHLGALAQSTWWGIAAERSGCNETVSRGSGGDLCASLWWLWQCGAGGRQDWVSGGLVGLRALAVSHGLYHRTDFGLPY